MKDQLLMTNESWELRDYMNGERTLHSFIAHICPVDKNDYYWWNLMIIDRPCIGCGEYPPQDMMGLWRLHNWDYIQTEDF